MSERHLANIREVLDAPGDIGRVKAAIRRYLDIGNLGPPFEKYGDGFREEYCGLPLADGATGRNINYMRGVLDAKAVKQFLGYRR